MLLFLSKFIALIKIPMKSLLFFLSMIFLFSSFQLAANELQPLYEYELPMQENTGVVDQSPFIRQGITEVLIRVSGSEKILQFPAVKEVLNAPDKYVKRLSYHQHPTAGRSIKILFNEKLINQLLSKLPQPALQQQRPLILVWLMVDKAGAPYSVGNDSEPLIADEMSKALIKRAIPFTFPLLDLTDVNEVSELEVWNGTLTSLEQGAKRYEPEAILLGRLKNSADQWKGSWTLLRGVKNTTWLSEGKTLENLLSEAAETLSVKLIDPNSKTSMINTINEQTTIQHLSVAISSILNMEQYAKVLDYLRQLPSVVEVEVTQIMPEKTIFNLQTTSDKGSLVKSINEGSLLIEIPPPLNEEHGTSLSYKMAGVS